MSSLRSKNKSRKNEDIHEESGNNHLSSSSSSGGGSTSNTVSSSSSSPRPHSPTSPKDPLDDIQTLSLEEVTSTHDRKGAGKSSSLKSGSSSNPSSSSSSSKTRRSKSHSKRGKSSSSSGNKNMAPSSGDSIFQCKGASSDIIRSGHLEYNTMYASNDCGLTGPVTVNVVNAPNNSTMQCGCENINCPFCNLMLSIEKTDPTVLQ